MAAATLGLPRMHRETGEKRDFLPDLVRVATDRGVDVVIESGLGSGMGLRDEDYLAVSPRVRVGDNAGAFAQDVVLILRFPELDELPKLRTGATLVSMVHFPTRPRRIRRLRAAGLESVSLDSIEDAEGERMVENLQAVAWNGVEAAFDALDRSWPGLRSKERPPVRVTILGAGRIGKDAAEAATKLGRLDRAMEFAKAGLPGVLATVAGRNVTSDEGAMRELLRRTDVLVDATQRSDPTKPVVSNGWLAELPEHAVICDLAVDPYILEVTPPTVRGIEGIPRGDLDQWIFAPGDAKWDETVPAEVPSANRRTTASCYSWPGVHARECMEHYGRQLAPLLETFLEVGGVDGLSKDGPPLVRSLWKASLRAQRDPDAAAPEGGEGNGD